jgi:hypothetical protein
MTKVEYNANLFSYALRLYFYNLHWQYFLTPIRYTIKAFDRYDSLYIAHDNGLQYGLLRLFKKLGKKTYLYEEGIGNYVGTNLHSGIKQKVKNIGYLLNLPSGFLGESRYVDTILLQYPQLVNRDNTIVHHKLKKTTKTLPSYLREKNSKKELAELFPVNEMSKILTDNSKHQRKKIILILTEPRVSGLTWNHDITLKEIEYFRAIIKRETKHGKIAFIKQHPRDSRDLKSAFAANESVYFVHNAIPIEMLGLFENNIEKISVYSYGCTAILNLWKIFGTKLEIFFLVHPHNERKNLDTKIFTFFKNIGLPMVGDVPMQTLT